MIPGYMQEAYSRYISSAAWKSLRDQLIELTYSTECPDQIEIHGNYRCQKCLWYFKKQDLEVHHLHYGNLGHEKKDDLIVVCRKCHDELDMIRAREGRERSERAYDNAGFCGWAEKVYGENWQLDRDIDQLEEEYYEWLEEKEDDYY